MQLEKIYFFTSSIIGWKHLLKNDLFKEVIINSIYYLSDNNYINVYGFVIMPNHIHLIFESRKTNGKEMPHESFMKYTGHEFKRLLSDTSELELFRVESPTRLYQFWQRDSLAIELYSRKVMVQKLNYIHANPVQPHWNLCSDFVDYYYSSASFYEKGISDFTFLKHFMDRM